MKHLFLFLAYFTCYVAWAQSSQTDTSITYESLIQAYQELSDSYSQCDLIEFGNTDSGKPLHLFILNRDEMFYPEAFQQKAIILIQNGIHAGEPCGIDASLQFARDLLASNTVPGNVIIGIIPVYNVGGMLNRGCCSRANQNGPLEYGFRGNARNLDLNRDYIKGDSKNVFAFYQVFHWLKPHVFIDTHTSNGADYQYTMTLISTRHERLSESQGKYLNQTLEPYIYNQFDTLIPYVNVFGGRTPFDGFTAFNDLARYSTGYASLFNCFGFTTEAHMLKSFSKRVSYTRKFINVITQFSNDNYQDLIKLKREATAPASGYKYDLNLKLDKSKYDSLLFWGYESFQKNSSITGEPQLYYDNTKPLNSHTKYYNYFQSADQVKVPKIYVVKGAYNEVIQRLKANHIQMQLITSDTIISGLGSYLIHATYSKQPYEGHWPITNAQIKDSLVNMSFRQGDYLVPLNQEGWRYILQTLEPKAEDSFFSWNFFDVILGQKEHFSDYVFEPHAVRMLEEDDRLRANYNRKLATDSAFATDGYMRLNWIYQQSDFYEKEHNQLPFLRIY